MCEDVDRDPADRVERREHEQGLVSGEAEDGAALWDDDEGSFVQKEGVDVADGSARKLEGKLAISTRDVVSWNLVLLMINFYLLE